MIRNIHEQTVSARVFLSYSRSDGEVFAQRLRNELLRAGIPLWQDRIGLEGGHNWWLQIEEAISNVEFFVLIMTPAAMNSTIVRKEWVLARQQGVCVYPVIACPKSVFSDLIRTLPRWMRDVHFYDLGQDIENLNQGAEWSKFINDLNTRCQTPRVPFMVEDLPQDFVLRQDEYEKVVDLLIDSQREEPIAITTALRGAGGYGKTTLALAICHDDRIQQAFDDGILWVTLGQQVENLTSKVEALIYALTGKTSGAPTLEAARGELVKILEDRDILLVVDDVWDATSLKPFLQGGKRCARLITTRNRDILPLEIASVNVDSMKQSEAVSLLGMGLDISHHTALGELASRLGRWPLLLKLVNGVLRSRRNEHGQSLEDALDYANKALTRRNLTVFDPGNPKSREQAVSTTLDVSLDLLSEHERARFYELAIFPDDAPIPLSTIEQFWAVTGDLDDFDTEMLCDRLYNLSLLLEFNPTARFIKLHDVIRLFLRSRMAAQLAGLNQIFLSTYELRSWIDLSQREPYLWDTIGYHLLEANRTDELISLAKDLRFLSAKIRARDAFAAQSDVSMASRYFPHDWQIQLLKRSIGNMTHLFSRCESLQEIEELLYCRLQHIADLGELCQQLQNKFKSSHIEPLNLLPDLPHPMLVRTLVGHESTVTACDVNNDGTRIVSASWDKTLRVWNLETGEELLRLEGHQDTVRDCAFSPDGRRIVSASDDKTVCVWNAITGEQLAILRGHQLDVLCCYFSFDGNWIVSGSRDQTLRLWDAESYCQLKVFTGHSNFVRACVVSADNGWFVSASWDKTVRLWPAALDQEVLVFEGHKDNVLCCDISSDAQCVLSGSQDNTLIIWDRISVSKRKMLSAHSNAVTACAFSSNGSWIVSGSRDKSIIIWDALSGEIRQVLYGHTSDVEDCLISPDEKWIVSASDDKTVKIWDVNTQVSESPRQGHRDYVRCCRVSSDGQWVVSGSDDRTLKIWNALSGENTLSLRGHDNVITACEISPDGKWILSASDDRTLRLWSARTGLEERAFRGHQSIVTSCGYAPDGQWVVSASDDQTLRLWDLTTGETIKMLRGHQDSVLCCSVSPNGQRVISGSWDNSIKVWNVADGELTLTLFGHNGAVRNCVFSPNGQWIISASYDRTIKIWSVKTGNLEKTLHGHRDFLRDCSVSGDGQFIASVSWDNTLKVWNFATGECLATFHADGRLNGCDFSPNSDYIVCAGNRGLYWLKWIN